MNQDDFKKITSFLLTGKIGIFLTDTVYGIQASAFKPEAVKRIYYVKRRNPQKPLIILISKKKDLNLFGIKLTNFQNNFLKKVWPGKISVILPCYSEKFKFLHLGKKTLAFRLPKKKILHLILEKTGPLVSTSANFSGKKTVQNLREAQKYFGKKIDFYFPLRGKPSPDPSVLVDLTSKEIKIVRGKFSYLRL